MNDQSGIRQRATPKALIEDDYHLTFRETIAKFYRENPPDFTVKKDVANRYGVAYFLVMLNLQCYLVAWTLVPHLTSEVNTFYWRLFILLIYIETFYNWFQCCRKYINKAIQRPEDAGKNELVGWKLCTICQYYTPPRAHHCKLCKACILRQDHHCYFAAGCIGHVTLPYFVSLCLWLSISQVTTFYWLIKYMLVEFDNLWMWFPPTAFWASITKYQPWFNFLCVAMLCFILLNIAVSFFYLIMSLFAATENVTFYEGAKGIRRFGRGSILANVRAALGSYFWIRWLVPFYVSPEGDGYEWNTLRHEQ